MYFIFFVIATALGSLANPSLRRLNLTVNNKNLKRHSSLYRVKNVESKWLISKETVEKFLLNNKKIMLFN